MIVASRKSRKRVNKENREALVVHVEVQKERKGGPGYL